MPSNRVIFSFFRYPASHAVSAFLLMGFQGFFRGKDRPGGIIRLMGCGGQDGFSIVPDFNRYCLMSTLTHPEDFEQVRRTNFYQRVARPSIEQLHFMLEPLSGHGTWDGEAIFDYSNRRVGHRPFAVLTHATVNLSRAKAFWRGVPDIRRQLRESPDCAYHIGFGEQPLLTLATFSVWEDLDRMQAFAYRDSLSPPDQPDRASRALAGRIPVRSLQYRDDRRRPGPPPKIAGIGLSSAASPLAQCYPPSVRIVRKAG